MSISETNKTEALPDNKNYLVREDFEATKGVFYAGQDNYANLDRRNSFAGKSSMSVSLPSQLNDFSLKVRMPEWDLKKYGTLSFAYLIPQSMPITLRVKTNFDEWVCLGKSGEADCPQIKNAIPVTLIDDGTWHEIKIDVRAAMQEMLPALHSLQSVEFYFPRNRHAGDILLIDDFNISGPKQNP